MPEDYNYIKDEPIIIPEDVGTPPPPKDSSSQPKSWLLAVIGVLVGAALAAAAFLLFFRPASNTSSDGSDDNTNTDTTALTDEDILKTYEEDILKADEEDQFILNLDKANRLVSMGRANEALAVLSSIPTDNLDDDHLYQLYSSYLFLYSTIGDETETAHYTALFDEVYARLDAAGRFAGSKETEATE